MAAKFHVIQPGGQVLVHAFSFEGTPKQPFDHDAAPIYTADSWVKARCISSWNIQANHMKGWAAQRTSTGLGDKSQTAICVLALLLFWSPKLAEYVNGI